MQLGRLAAKSSLPEMIGLRDSLSQPLQRLSSSQDEERAQCTDSLDQSKE